MTGTSDSQVPRRVLLLSDGSPLSLGVESLLHEITDLEVARCSDEGDVLERIRAFQPDAVVLGAPVRTETLAPDMQRILDQVPGLSLITLSLQDNTVHIYQDGQLRTLRDATGLLNAFHELDAPAEAWGQGAILERRDDR